MAKEHVIGPYSAYAIAVKHGFVGTEAEWAALQKNAPEYARAAAQSAESAAGSATNAASSQKAAATSENAAEAAKTAASQSAQAASTSAASASNAQTAAEASADTALAAEQAAEEAASRAQEVAASIPEDYTALAEAVRLKAPAIICEASGDIVTVTDAAAEQAVSLVSHIEPVQEGEGDPSPVNVRPISGWDEVQSGRYRHNMLHITAESKVTNGISFTINPDKSVTVNGTATANAYLQLYEGFTLPSGDFVLSGCPAGGNDKTKYSLQLYRIIDGMSKIFTADNGSGLAFSSEPNIQYTVTIVVRAGWTADNLVFYPMLQPKGVSADYEPGDVQMVSADLPETVYGGTPDWTTGLLTVTHARYNFTGNENWSVSSVQRPELGIRFDTSKIAGQPLAKNNAVISDTYPFAGVTMPGCWVTTHESGYFAARILWPNYETVDDLVSYLTERYNAGNPVSVVYELAEPYTIQLTPQQLTLLKGTNNVWSSTGPTDLQYIADTKLYINDRIAAIAAAALSN